MLKNHQATLGDHIDTISAHSNLARVLKQQSKAAEAEIHYRAAFAKCRAVLGEGHQDTLTAINALAVHLHETGITVSLLRNDGLQKLFYRLGKVNEAQRLYSEALAGRRLLRGDKHIDTIQSLGNLASCYHSQNKLHEAEPLYVEALALSKEVYGTVHRETLESMNLLASVWQAQDRLLEAEALYRDAMEQSQQQLGKTHADTLAFSNNLAVLLKKQGRFDEAEELHRKSLQGRREALGDAHPVTKQSMNNLALLLKAKSKLSHGKVASAPDCNINTDSEAGADAKAKKSILSSPSASKGKVIKAKVVSTENIITTQKSLPTQNSNEYSLKRYHKIDTLHQRRNKTAIRPNFNRLRSRHQFKNRIM